MSEKAKKCITAKGLEDLSVRGLQQYLEAKYQVLQDWGEDGAIIPVDNVLHSMWSGVDITMNGELISTTSQKYMYKSYIETILNNSHSTKEYQLKLSGYFGDDGDKDEDYLMNWNKGMEQRHLCFRDSQKVEMIGFILSDIFGIQASIVNGVEIGITLIPNKDIMPLQSFCNRKFGHMVIDDIYLYVCKRQFTNKIVVAHAGIMEETKATYPFKCTEVRAYNGDKGNTEVTIENPYESKIPTRFILGMVGANNYIGNWRKNPLNFKHYDISSAVFYIDDESTAKQPYKLNPSDGKFIEPFMELYSILGKAGKDVDIGISTENYLEGTFLLPFDVTPTSATNMEYLGRKMGGNCRIELQFCKPLPHNIMIITYAIFPMELQIDMARNCREVPVHPVLKELKAEEYIKMCTGSSAHITSNHGWIKHFSIDCCFAEEPHHQKML